MLVSVIMPTFNSEDTIERSTFSVLNQTYDNLELIICDDKSSDSTVKFLADLQKTDPRVIVIHNERNGGAGFSRSNAISEAKGEYCAFLDSDDEWDLCKLQKQILFMEINNINISYTDVLEKSDKKRRIRKARQAVTFLDMHKKNFIATSSAIIRRKCIKFNFQNLRKRQDYVFWLQNMQHGEVAHGLNEVLTTYHVRSGSLSNTNRGFLPIYHFAVFRTYLKYSIFKTIIYVSLNIYNRLRSD